MTSLPFAHEASARTAKRPFWWALFLAVLLALPLAWNVVNYPPQAQYDYGQHRDMILMNKSLKVLVPNIPNNALMTNPPYYWYVLGKATRVVKLLAPARLEPIDDTVFFRLAHSAGLCLIAFLLVRRLSDKYRLTPAAQGVLGLGIAVIPNVYLAQVMVRADHLAFLALYGLLLLWYCRDLGEGFWTARRRDILAWSALVVALANTRHIVAPAVALFLLMAGLRYLKEFGGLSRRRRILAPTLLAVVVAASSHYYGVNYLRTGHLISQPIITPYYQKHAQAAKDFDRVSMFTNMDFGALLEEPNREAPFKPYDAFWPRLYGDMWGDHWLFFSGANRTENRPLVKKAVFVAAAPFTLAYLLLPLAYGVAAGRRLLSGRMPDLFQSSGLMFAGGLLALVTFVWSEPEPGKNSTVKFIYIYPYVLLPILCIVDTVRRHAGWARVVLAYLALLVAAASPLYFYVP